MIKTAILSLALLASVTLDRSLVRFGDTEAFLKSQNGKVGVIKSQKVYKSIPAYQTIITERVKKDTARWFNLMTQATNTYRACVTAIAKSQKMVLVVETGGIQGYPVVSITEMCIQRVKTMTPLPPLKSQK